jgi:hypothetical protein
MRRALVVVVTALVGSTLMSCGSGSDGRTATGVGDPFAARAMSVCQIALRSKQAWAAFPAADFDPSQPDPSAFPKVAAWLEDEVAPTFEAWLGGLKTLGTPPSGQDSWSEVLSAVGTIVQLNADQVTAATSNDTEGFVEAKDDLAATQTELERATQAAGVPMCADVHA